MNTAAPVQLVAVVGGSGAGKSWLVERLCRVLDGKACQLHLDNFYRDRSHLPPSRRAQLNYDIPNAIDWESAERVLRDCRAGRPTRVPHYDFATHCRVGDESAWTPRALVFVDGLWLLRPPAIRELFDLRIYLDTPTDVRCQRRRERDVIERGYARAEIERQLRTAVLPMHARYVESQKAWADLVLAHPLQEAHVAALADRLWAMLTRAGLVARWMHETFRADLVELLCTHEHEYCN